MSYIDINVFTNRDSTQSAHQHRTQTNHSHDKNKETRKPTKLRIEHQTIQHKHSKQKADKTSQYRLTRPEA